MNTSGNADLLSRVIKEEAENLLSDWMTQEVMGESEPAHRRPTGIHAPTSAEWSALGERVLEAMATGDVESFSVWLWSVALKRYPDRLLQSSTQSLTLRTHEHLMKRCGQESSPVGSDELALFRERSADVLTALTGSIIRRTRDAMPSEASEFQEMASVLRDTLYSSLIGGTVRYVSPSIEPLTGHSVADFLDKEGLWSRLVLPEDLKIYRMLLSEAMETGESMEAVYRLRNVETHRVHHVLDRVTPVHSPTGEVLRLDGIVIDITDRIEFETRLERAEQLRILGQLARDIAHDFNNLLVSILGHTDLLLTRMKGDETATNGLRMVARAAEKGARLTERLLAFARGSSSAGTREFVRLDEVVMEAIELARPSAPRHLELRLDSPPSISLVEGNPTSLSEAILNLILNGIHACTEGQGTAVTLKINEGDVDDCHLIGASHSIVLEIIDDGHGMSEEVKMRVFEPLFTTRTAVGGTGLGCALAFGVAIEHGGVLEVDSVENLGTTFTLILPATVETKVETRPMTPVVGLQHTGREGPAVVDARVVTGQTERTGPRVLSVDDDPNVRRLLKDLLHGAGYRVTSVESGAEALELLRSETEPFDLLLLDVMMHPMDGTELYTRAMQVRPDLPALFCSGHSDDETVSVPEALETVPMIAKPFRAATLFQTVRKVLGTDAPS